MGVIDLHDVSNSALIEDIATCIMHCMNSSKNLLYVDPMDVGGFLLAGYSQYYSLTDCEWDSLHLFIMAKCAVSFVMNAHSSHVEPSNVYAVGEGWNEIWEEFWRTPKEKICERWKRIIRDIQVYLWAFSKSGHHWNQIFIYALELQQWYLNYNTYPRFLNSKKSTRSSKYFHFYKHLYLIINHKLWCRTENQFSFFISIGMNWIKWFVYFI